MTGPENDSGHFTCPFCGRTTVALANGSIVSPRLNPDDASEFVVDWICQLCGKMSSVHSFIQWVRGYDG